MPAGRPSEYTPALGNELIELMATGLSLTAAAASLGFHRDTMYDWSQKHPEFSDALKLAKGKRVLKLETDLLDAPDGPTVTSRIFALENADPTEWRDRVQQEITGKDGGPIEVAKTLADLDDAERELLRQLVGKRAGGE